MIELFLEVFVTFVAYVLSWRCIVSFGLALFAIGLTLWLVPDPILRSIICLSFLIAGLVSGILWERRIRRSV